MVYNIVPLDGDGVNALQAVPEAQLLQRRDAAGLQQLAHDAVGLLQPPFEQDHAAALLGECEGRRAAKDAGAYDDDVGFVMQASPVGIGGLAGTGREDGPFRWGFGGVEAVVRRTLPLQTLGGDGHHYKLHHGER